MEHWATIFDCIEHGIVGDKAKAREYAELLMQRLEHTGEMRQAERLRNILQGKSSGQIIRIAEERSYEQPLAD